MTQETTLESMLLIKAFNAFSDVIPHLWDLGRSVMAGRVLAQHQAMSDDSVAFKSRLTMMGTRMADERRRLRDRLISVQCPFPFGSEPITIAARCGLSSDAEPDRMPAVLNEVWTLVLRGAGAAHIHRAGG